MHEKKSVPSAIPDIAGIDQSSRNEVIRTVDILIQGCTWEVRTASMPKSDMYERRQTDALFALGRGSAALICI